MKVLSDKGEYEIDSLTNPLQRTHFWVFDAKEMDFMLAQFEYLEETHGASVRVKIHNTELVLPASWFVLAIDRETYEIDTIPIQACATYAHEIILFNPKSTNLQTATMDVLEFIDKKRIIHAAPDKHQAMIIPIDGGNIIISKSDLWAHIKGKTYGDMIS